MSVVGSPNVLWRANDAAYDTAGSATTPTNSVLPSISGTPQVGQTLTANVGTWAGSPTSYAYVWRRNGAAISGAAASTYTLVSGDLGYNITVTVTAANAAGSAPATSAAVGPVAAALAGVPVNTALPAITGTAQEGSVLTVTPGSFTNSPTSRSYVWKRAGVTIAGASGTTYLLVAGDVGATITVAETATNASGPSAAATSAATATVTAAASGGFLTLGNDAKLPKVKVELALASGPAQAPVWTDVTPYVRGFRIRRGRDDVLNRFQAGELSDLELDNRDRRFDPGNAAGPHFGNLRPMKRVRVRAQWGGSGGTLYRDAVLADLPYAYWRFAETSGTTAADASGNGRTGTYNGGVTLGVAGATGDADKAASFDGVDDYVGSNFLLNTGTVTIEAWVYLTAVPASNAHVAGFINGLGAGTSDKLLQIRTDGKAYFYVYDGAAKLTSTPASAIPLNQWVHLAGTADGTTARCFVNGVQVGSVAAGASYTGYSVNNFFVAAAATGAPLVYLVGKVDEVSLNTAALAQARLSAHVAAGPAGSSGSVYDRFYGYTDGFPQRYPEHGKNATVTISAADVFKVLELVKLPADFARPAEASHLRLHALCDVAKIPSADRNFASGSAVVAAAPAGSLEGTSVLAHAMDVMDAEGGALFAAASGILTFQHRQHRTANEFTARATFGDGAGELGFTDIEPTQDDEQFWNEGRVTPASGNVQTHLDTVVQASDFPRVFTKSVPLASDLDALALAQYVVQFYKAAMLRLPEITLEGAADPVNLWPKILATELSHHVKVNSRPPGGGAANVYEQYVEQIEEAVGIGSWKTRFGLSPADMNTYWVLGTDALGVGTRLSY